MVLAHVYIHKEIHNIRMSEQCGHSILCLVQRRFARERLNDKKIIIILWLSLKRI